MPTAPRALITPLRQSSPPSSGSETKDATGYGCAKSVVRNENIYVQKTVRTIPGSPSRALAELAQPAGPAAGVGPQHLAV